jgi:hypothetical protein
VLFATHPQHAPGAGELPPWSVIWLLDEPHAAR